MFQEPKEYEDLVRNWGEKENIKKIEAAIKDMLDADRLRREADQIYHRARKRLESLCSPAVPTGEKVIKALSRRREKAYK